MTVIRAFIAIDLAPDLRRSLDQVAAGLKQQLKTMPVRWVSVDNIHLTLKFLGEVSVANMEMLKEILQAEAEDHTAFDLNVQELGAFPSLHRPRVVWVKVVGPPELELLQRGIENEMARMGYACEDRAFSPHLTLGRISRNATQGEVRQIGEVLAKTRIGLLGTMQVRSVELYRSDLRPAGPIYTCLHSAPFST